MTRKVLITGATSGIGEALANRLHQKGAALLLTGRNQEKLLSQEKLFGAKTLQADLSKKEDLLRVLMWMREEKPNLVINNAGFGFYGDASSMKSEELLDMIRVNCEAVTMLTTEAVTLWRQEKILGTVLTVSSAAGYLPMPHLSVYAATKAYVNSFSYALFCELEKEGIAVLAACPGMVATAFSERASRGRRKKKPMFMTLTAEEVAETLLWQIEKKKPLHIIDYRYRLLLLLSKVVPLRWVASLTQKFVSF